MVAESSQNEDMYEIDIVKQAIDQISEKSTATYSDISENTDIKYDVLPGTVKESIIINDASALQDRYNYEITAAGLRAELLEDNSIEFYAADGKVIFSMPAPYMLDSAEEPGFSSDIQIEFTEIEAGGYSLSYIPDEEWLKSPERVFPVIIDPTISTQPSEHYAEDIFLFDDLPELPAGSVIQKARYVVEDISFGRSFDDYISIYGLLSDGSLTDIIDQKPFLNDISSMDFDLTKLISEWYREENSDGFVMGGHPTWLDFFGYIEIQYITPEGYDRSGEYRQVYLDEAGNAYINDFSGSLYVERSEMNFENDFIMSGIWMAYNESSDNAWTSNYDQIYIDSNCFTDEHGFKIYWRQSGNDPENGVVSYVDEMLRGYEMTITNGSVYEIVTPDGDIYTKSGAYEEIDIEKTLLDEMTSINVKKVTNGYTADTIITADESYYYRINNSGQPTSIEYFGTDSSLSNAVSEVVFNYNSDSRLISVEYPDGATAGYTYNANGYLESMTDNDGDKVLYEYTQGSIPRIARVEEYDAADNLLQWTDFEYGVFYTRITDSFGHEECKQFNKNGQALSIINEGGITAYTQHRDDDMSPMIDKQLEPSPPINNLLQNGGFELSDVSMYSESSVSGAFPSVESAYDEDSYNGEHAFSLTFPDSEGEYTVRQTVTPVNLSQDIDSFTFSAWVKTDSGSKARILLKNTTLDTFAQSDYTDTVGDWQLLRVNLEGGTGDTYQAELYAMGSGRILFDSLQLAPLDFDYATNLANNGDFAQPLSGNHWNSFDSFELINFVPRYTLDSKIAFHEEDEYPQNNALTQRISIDGKEGDTFVFGGWAKANSLPLGSIWTEPYEEAIRSFGMSAKPLNTNAPDASPAAASFSFNPYYDDWQYLKGSITLEEDAMWLEVSLLYDYNIGGVYFDGLEIYKAEPEIQQEEEEKIPDDDEPDESSVSSEFIEPSDDEEEIEVGEDEDDEEPDPPSYASQTLGTGYYYISLKHSGQFLDVYNANKANYTSVLQYPIHGDNNQIWKLTYLGGGYYTIRPAHATDYALHVYSDKLSLYYHPNNTLTMPTYYQWEIRDVGNRYFNLVNRSALSKRAGIYGSSTTAGIPLTVSNATSDSTKFIFSRVDPLLNGNYFVQSLYDNRYLDAAARGTANFTDVSSYNFNGNFNQQWKFTYLGNFRYVIRPAYSSTLALDVTGTNVDLYSIGTANNTSIPSYAQWIVLRNADGSCTFKNRSKGAGAGIADASATAYSAYGRNVVSYGYHGGTNQKWRIGSTQYGSGGPYRKVTTDAPNCLGYALHENGVIEGPNPGKTVTAKSYRDDYLLKFIRDNRKGISCSAISGYNSAINLGEYRMALRVHNGSATGTLSGFHVVYQLYDGSWAGKNDTWDSEHFTGANINPDAVPRMWYMMINRLGIKSTPMPGDTAYFKISRQ